MFTFSSEDAFNNPTSTEDFNVLVSYWDKSPLYIIFRDLNWPSDSCVIISPKSSAVLLNPKAETAGFPSKSSKAAAPNP